MKTNVAKLMLILLLSASPFFLSQVGTDENEYTIPETYYYFDGEITFANREKIAGSVSLNHRFDQEFFTMIRHSEGIQYIPNREIAKVTFFGDGNYQKTAFEKFDDSGKLYRIVGTGKVTVFDSSVKPFSDDLVNTVYIKNEHKIVSIFDFWSSGPKQDLINYINRRDNKTFKKRDFKSTQDLVAYAVN